MSKRDWEWLQKMVRLNGIYPPESLDRAFSMMIELHERVTSLEEHFHRHDDLGLLSEAGGPGGAAHPDKDPMREAMLAGYRLSTYAASIHWDRSDNTLDWMNGLGEHIVDVQDKCKDLDPLLVETMKVRVDLPKESP